MISFLCYNYYRGDNMKKFISVLIICMVILLTGCDKKSSIKTVSSIKLNKEQYIEQLKNINIENSNDTIKITKKVKWKVPKEADGNTTVSFSIIVPYTITVNGIKYNGEYHLNSSEWSTNDYNPKYKFKVVNLTKQGDLSIYITKK